jgi:hypothetical protein
MSMNACKYTLGKRLVRAGLPCLLALAPLLVLAPLQARAADCAPPDVLPDKLFPTVRLETSMGDIVVELDCRSSTKRATGS